MASDYHEPFELLDEFTRDLHRALISLKEEIEAADWYHQRIATCRDAALVAVLVHNKNEEIEHACMTLEWLRRNSSEWAERLDEHLYREGDITEESQESADQDAERPGSLGIGSLKGR